MPEASPFALPDLVHLASVAERLVAAGLLGGVIGAPREKVDRAAGVPTHILLVLGAPPLALAGREATSTSADPSRVVQGIITGIGFLGAGTILKLVDKAQVHGLTTAATIWVTSGVGVASALAPLWLAGFAAVLTWAVLALAIRLEGRRS